jgi:hypothetical protein
MQPLSEKQQLPDLSSKVRGDSMLFFEGLSLIFYYPPLNPFFSSIVFHKSTSMLHRREREKSFTRNRLTMGWCLVDDNFINRDRNTGNNGEDSDA